MPSYPTRPARHALSNLSSGMVVAVLIAVCAATLVMSASAVAAGPISWSAPMVIDHPPPYTDIPGIIGVSCPTESFCAGVTDRGDVITSTNPAGGIGAWRVTHLESGDQERTLVAISCPSAALCVAVDNRGNVLSSTDPGAGAGAWKVAHVDRIGSFSEGVASVSCATASLCVAVDAAGNVVSSTNPARGRASAWHVAHVDSHALNAVSCPSASLCVAVDGAGQALTSTDPAGGPGAWANSTVDRHPLRTISCASATLCVAGDDSGNVVSSASPAGGAGAWSLAHVDTATTLCPDPAPDSESPCPSWVTSISCPSRSLCVAGDANTGAIATSSNPTGGASAWTFTTGVANAPAALSCPTVSLCVGGEGGGVVTSTDPTGGASAWTAAPVGAVVRLTGVSCVSAWLCVVGDEVGRVLTSTDPMAPDPVWSAAALLPNYDGLSDITCTAPSFCVGIGSPGQILTSTDPTGGASAWTVSYVAPTMPSRPILGGVSCPSVSLCVAVSEAGNVFVSQDPKSSARAWTKTRSGTRAEFRTGGGFHGLSCPSVSLCVAVDDGGRIISSTTPAAPRPAWKVTHVNAPSGLASVSCPSVSLCVAADPYDRSLFVSTHPARGAASWRRVALSGIHPVFRPISVSCATHSLCVALDQLGSRVIESADPTGGAAGWSAARIDVNNLQGGGGLSCNRSFCIAGDDVGAAVLGVPAPRPTLAQLRKALRKQLVPSARGAAILLRRGGYRYPFRIPAPGRLTVSWSSGARRGRAPQRLRPILIATAKAYVGADTIGRVKIRLTHEGRRLLRRSAPLTVTAEARFTTAQHTVVARASFTLGSRQRLTPSSPSCLHQCLTRRIGEAVTEP